MVQEQNEVVKSRKKAFVKQQQNNMLLVRSSKRNCQDDVSLFSSEDATMIFPSKCHTREGRTEVKGETKGGKRQGCAR